MQFGFPESCNVEDNIDPEVFCFGVVAPNLNLHQILRYV